MLQSCSCNASDSCTILAGAHHFVPTGPLRAIERSIGFANEGRSIAVNASVGACHTEADRHRTEIAATVLTRQSSDGCAKVFSNIHRPEFIGFRKNDCKLLASVACRKVARATKRVQDRLCDSAETVIAVLVSVAVVAWLDHSAAALIGLTLRLKTYL
jgi:hypothetical protein